jgi:hypothetical protein
VKRTTWTLVGAVVLIGALAMPAAAGKRKVRTTVTIDHLASASPRTARAVLDVDFVGFVRSKKARCERRRAVSLFKTFGGTTEKIGTDRTNRSGTFRVFVATATHDFKGEYFAKARRKSTRRFLCKRAKSDGFSPFPP